MKPYYQNEFVTLYQGDCLAIMPVLKQKFDLLLTDPPYMIGASSMINTRAKSGHWPDMMNAAVWYSTWLQVAYCVLADDAAGYVFTNWRSLPTMFRSFYDAGIQVNNTLVWNKEWIGPAGKTQFRPLYEMILYFTRGNMVLQDRCAGDIISCKWMAGHSKTTEHPAEKPLDLCKCLIDYFPDAGYVIDPFAGSGTTGLAAMQTGRRAVLVEQEEKYCEIIAERMEQYKKIT